MSAGGHFNPFDKHHGLQNPAGPHAGDLPNVTVGPDGKAKVEAVAKLVTLKPGEKKFPVPVRRDFSGNSLRPG